MKEERSKEEEGQRLFLFPIFAACGLSISVVFRRLALVRMIEFVMCCFVFRDKEKD